MKTTTQKKLSLALLEWHGGMSSGLYAVGSCMLSDSERGTRYDTASHRGHAEAIVRALDELRDLKKGANFPETVTPKMEREAGKLADRLAQFLPVETINGTRIACYALPDDGQSFDRFTVVYLDEAYSDWKPKFRACVGLSGHGGAMVGKHLGIRIPFAELPDGLKGTVEMDTAVAECVTDSLKVS